MVSNDIAADGKRHPVTRLMLPGIVFLSLGAFLLGRWSAPPASVPTVAARSAMAQTVVPATGVALDGPWIRVIRPDDAVGPLKQIYAQFSREGNVDQIIQIHSIHPASLRGQIGAHQSLFQEPSDSLSLVDRHRVALAVSLDIGSLYCTTHHSVALMGDVAATRDHGALVQWAGGDTPRDRQMVAFARKLTAAPRTMTQADVDGLRKVGFSDRDVLEIALIGGYANFFNRITLALGLPPEGRWARPGRLR